MRKLFIIAFVLAGGITLGGCFAGPYGAIGYTAVGPVSLADCPQQRYIDPGRIDKPCDRVKGTPFQ